MTTLQNNQNYEPHAMADVFPMMERADLENLSRDIERNGQHQTIKWSTPILESGFRV